MTDQEINEAIAKKCGLKVKDIPIVPAFIDLHHDYLTDKAFREYRKAYPSGSIPMRVPDYCTDLNAMHEAERVLDSLPMDQQSKYLDYLYCTVGWDDANNARDARFKCHYGSVRAKARERAEAFLRTFGLWRE